MKNFQVGDKVDRKEGSYRFPGTILCVYYGSNGHEYAVVEMDEFLLHHIFRTVMLKHI